MTVKEWTEHWLEVDVRPKVRPTSFDAKRYILQNHIIAKLGIVPLEKLSEMQIGDFLDERKRFGNHRPKSPDYPALSDITMRHIHRMLQECLDRAVEAGLMPSNPARAFSYPTQRKAVTNVLSRREIDDYLDAAEELGCLPMFMLMLTAGLRQRELIALKWSDLDEQTGALTISEGRAVEKGRLVDYGEGTRKIQLSEEALTLLRQEHNKHPHSELMFPHPGTLKPYLPTMVRLLHQHIMEKAGLEHVRFEDLRHTYAVHALQNDTDIHELSKRLGHTRPSMTKMLYAEYLPDNTQKNAEQGAGKPTDAQLQTAADKLGAMLKF